MGEMADYYLDLAFDDEYFATRVHCHKVKTIVCKYCGETDLIWQKKNNKWILVHTEDGREHTCKNRKTEDVFYGK